MESTTLSLKSQLGEMFKHLERDYNEKMLHKHVKDLIGMLASNRFKFTCAHSHWYNCVDQQKARLHYEMHVVPKCMDICQTLHKEIDGEFAKLLIGYHIELFNLFFVRTKREKLQIHKRIVKLVTRIKATPVGCVGWRAGKFMYELKKEAIDLLTESIMVALK